MKMEGGRSLGRAPKGTHGEDFCKDLDLVQCIRQTYFRAHSPVFHMEVADDLADISGVMAKIAGLMGTEIHTIQKQRWGKKELHMAKGLTKNHCYF